MTERSIMPPLETVADMIHRQGSTKLLHDLSKAAAPFPVDAVLEEYSDYYPSEEIAHSVLQPTSRVHLGATKSDKFDKSIKDVPSGASSLGAANSDLNTPFSAGATPPSGYLADRQSLERASSYSQSLSASPEQLRHTPRSNSNLATAFTSFSRPFSFTTSASSSPPNAYLRKRVSPAGSYGGVSTQRATTSTAYILGRTSSATEESKSVYSVQGSEAVHTSTATKEPSIKINLKNQGSFHDEGHMKVSLLDPDEEGQYQAYRVAYAHILSIWDMPIKKIEILKYNSRTAGPQRASTKALDDQVPSLISIGRKAVHGTLSSSDKVILDIRRKCTVCMKFKRKDSSMQYYRCDSCASREMPLYCVFCAERIRGHAAPCLVCGHVVHSQCRLALLATSSFAVTDSTQHSVCVIGCGCQCGESGGAKVELPDIPALKSLSPSIVMEADRAGAHGWQDDEDAREDVAYESLAKNLRAAGAKYVRPKASQIWRGMERKASSQGR